MAPLTPVKVKENTAVGSKVDRSDGTRPELLKWASIASMLSAVLLLCPRTKGAKATEITKGRTNMTGRGRCWLKERRE